MTGTLNRVPAQAEPVLGGVWRIGGDSWNGTLPTLSAEGDANVYLLARGGPPAMVDCGTLAGQSRVAANLRATGHAVDEVVDLLLTHSHFDHTQACSAWQAATGLQIHLHDVGASALARGDQRLVGHHVRGPDYVFAPFVVDHVVRDGERFPAGGVAVTAHLLPGHTPDSTLYTFVASGRRVGICGDIAFGARPRGGPALGLLSNLWGSDLDAYVDSLRRLERLRLDVLLPGHGGVVHGRELVAAAVAGALATAERLAADEAVRSNLGV